MRLWQGTEVLYRTNYDTVVVLSMGKSYITVPTHKCRNPLLSGNPLADCRAGKRQTASPSILPILSCLSLVSAQFKVLQFDKYLALLWFALLDLTGSTQRKLSATRSPCRSLSHAARPSPHLIPFLPTPNPAPRTPSHARGLDSGVDPLIRRSDHKPAGGLSRLRSD